MVEEKINPNLGLKILHHPEELRQVMDGNEVFPITVELFPSDKCNQRCSYCMVESYHTQYGAVMSWELMEKVLNEMAGRTKSINFTGGGDPYLNSRVRVTTDKGIALAHKNGIDVGVISNGVHMDEHSIDTIVENAVWVRISLDAVTPSVYNQVRYQRTSTDGSAVNRVLRNLNLFMERKQATGSELMVGAQVVLVDENIDDLENTVKVAADTGLAYIHIRPPELRPYKGETEYSEGHLTRARLAVQNVIDKFPSDKFPNFAVLARPDKFRAISDSKFEKEYSYCWGSHFTSVITASGKVYHCFYWVGNPDFEIGDLSKQSYEEVFMGPKRKQVRQKGDIRACQPICKNHGLNLLLHTYGDKGVDYMVANLRQEGAHKNFI